MHFATPQPERPSIFWPLLLSLLLIHLPLLYLLFFADWQTPPDRTLAVKPPQQMPVMLNLQSLPLVDQAQPKTEQIPDQASAVGQYNVKTEVETVAAPTSVQSSTTKTQKNAENKSTSKTPVENKTEKQTPPPVQTPPENTEPKSLKDVLAKLDSKQKTDEAKIDSLFQNSKANDANFKSSMEPSGDYLPAYKVGNKTYVNALAYPHVGYFVEMKRKFRTAWNPIPTLRGKTGQLPPHQIQTVWGFTIDGGGQIIAMTLIQSSPIIGYDQEAKRTILASAPFAPPPAELLKGATTLDVAFGFVVYY